MKAILLILCCAVLGAVAWFLLQPPVASSPGRIPTQVDEETASLHRQIEELESALAQAEAKLSVPGPRASAEVLAPDEAAAGLPDATPQDIQKEWIADWKQDVSTLTLAEVHTLLAHDDVKSQFRGLKALHDLEDRDQAIALAVEMLDSEHDKVRYVAMELLADWQGPRAADHLVDLLGEDEPGWLVQAAVRRLSEFENPIAIEPLRQLWERSDGILQRQTAIALHRLGETGPARAMTQTAQERLTSTDGSIRSDAIRTLAAFDDLANNVTFANALSDPDGGVREAAAKALARQGTSSELPALQLLAHDPVDSVATAASRAIQFIESPEDRDGWDFDWNKPR